MKASLESQTINQIFVLFFRDQEVQILDYQTQQYRVFVPIARTLVFLFATSEIRDLHLKVTEQLNAGDTRLLPELHALSSGLKSIIHLVGGGTRH